MKLSILLPLLAQGQKEWTCKDLLPDNGCAQLPSNMCKNFYHANYQCPDTCGKCAGDPLRPINTVSVCYRDSPCNELGTEGGNADGCSQVELYPFFKCKCKPLWDGYRCQWFNCPCQNGGECRPCINNRKNCIDEKRKCSCPAGYTGRYCETKKRPSGPDKTPSPPTQPPTRPPTQPPTQPPTTTTIPRTTPVRTTTTPEPTFTVPTQPPTKPPTQPPTQPPVTTPVFGQWSEWTQCNTQQEQYRQRFCTDGSTIRYPKCCYGMIKSCSKYNKLPDDARKPEQATRACTISAFWSEWSSWSKVCNKKNEGLKTYRRRKCLNGKKIISVGCQGGPPLKKQIKRCPKWQSGTTGTPKTPWTTARPITRPVTEPNVNNDPSKNGIVEVNSNVESPLNDDAMMQSIMDSLPPLPNGIQADINWNTVQQSLTMSPFPPPMPSGNAVTTNGANIHYHFQCWPQCLGLRKPYLCIVPSWCAKEYAGKRTFWMFN